MSLSRLATTDSLNLPRTANIASVASAFGLDARWTATTPTASILDALALPVNASNRASTFIMDYWNVSSTASNIDFVQDPFEATQNLVLSVNYPAGTRDGTQFFMTPMQSGANVQTAVLQYEVAFDTGFDFVKGGKLPGLYGSEKSAESICSGGNRQPSCFSARLMWRQRGSGEVYAYIPVYDGFCRQSDVDCNDKYGISLSRGSFKFAAGGWTTITQLVSLNTPGFANGLLYLWANNTLALAQTGLVWRTQSSVTLSKIMFSTFFGGSDSSWDSHGGRAYFRNFEVYAGRQSSNTTGPAVNATLVTTSSASSSSPLSTISVIALLSSLFLSLQYS
ncbi:uncharacterized protein JCM15063_000670 [Sporobolomyces koalae]|uniref:uncharacterized protein n=1 Tax=Sporobolomyces koalae TaxID=500713 RepID=UPI00317DAB94